MKLFSRLHAQRYCAFCKAPRRVYVKKHIDVTNVVGMLLFVTAITYFIWGTPDPRGLMLFCVFIAVSETFVQLRWRMNIVCNLCGFDPVTYKKSPARARQKVKDFFEENRNDPEFWMTRSPLVDLQKKIRIQERKADVRRELRIQIDQRAKRSLPPPKSL